MGKCIACGVPTEPGDVFCRKCKGAGNAHTFEKDGAEIGKRLSLALTLSKGESVEKALVCSTKNPKATLDTGPAPLTLFVLITDERAIAIEESDLLGGKHDLFRSIELEDIRELTIRPGYFSDTFVIGFQTRGGGPGEIELWSVDDLDIVTYEQKGMTDLAGLREWLQAKAEVRRRSAEEREKLANERSGLDFGILREELARGGIVLQGAKCPNCGATLDIPESGSAMKCKYCDGSIIAQEILAKLRAVIAPG